MGDFLLHLHWDPARELFSWKIPFLGRPILWYGFFYALAFYVGYIVLYFDLKHFFKKQQAIKIAEKILVFMAIGTLIGARLGDLLFYQSKEHILSDPLVVFRVWEGGLASHGAAFGTFLTLFFLSKYFIKKGINLTFFQLLDLLIIPFLSAAFLIRIGNFFNQEILGRPTTLPWAIVFEHPLGGESVVARHPVQLYESFFYFSLAILFFFFKKKIKGKEGFFTGLAIFCVFSFRFFIEFLKEEQSDLIHSSFLTMGQYLSLPMIGIGLLLLFLKSRKNLLDLLSSIWR